jgi:broad specificity phosphatase PhoE
MEVYFVRHGQTDGNVAMRHQHPDTEINEVGKVETEAVAKQIKVINPTHIVSSTQLRAIETTKNIIKCCPNIIPETHGAFEELKRPDWLVGHRFIGVVTAAYIWRWFHGKKIEGGESYRDFILRTEEAKRYLETFPKDARVVVVSHSVFINIFLEHLCTSKPMNLWRAIKRFFKVLTIRNASIVKLEYQEPTPGTCGWKIVSFVPEQSKL